jgi:hypothetical protein
MNISPPSSESKNKPSKKPPALSLAYCSAYFSTLKMEAICSSETSVDFQRTTQRYIPEDSTLHNHRCENLKSHSPHSFLGFVHRLAFPTEHSVSELHLFSFSGEKERRHLLNWVRQSPDNPSPGPSNVPTGDPDVQPLLGLMTRFFSLFRVFAFVGCPL